MSVAAFTSLKFLIPVGPSVRKSAFVGLAEVARTAEQHTWVQVYLRRAQVCRSVLDQIAVMLDSEKLVLDRRGAHR